MSVASRGRESCPEQWIRPVARGIVAAAYAEEQLGWKRIVGLSPASGLIDCLRVGNTRRRTCDLLDKVLRDSESYNYHDEIYDFVESGT